MLSASGVLVVTFEWILNYKDWLICCSYNMLLSLFSFLIRYHYRIIIEKRNKGVIELKFSIKPDSSGQDYIEIETVKDQESVRITYINDGFTKTPCIRLNIHRYGKGLRPGPEFPIKNAAEIQAAITQLLLETENKR